MPRPGIRKLLLKSAHGDNRQPLQDVADAAAAKFDPFISAQEAPLLYIFSSRAIRTLCTVSGTKKFEREGASSVSLGRILYRPWEDSSVYPFLDA